jgi:hypothetical protein
LLRQLQDIPEEESDASDDDIFEPNGDEDEDYEPPKTASNSSDCDAEDTCRLEEELEDYVQQQVMLAVNVGHAGCSTRRRGTARGNRGRGRGRGTGRVEFMGHSVDTDCVGKDNETKWTVIESGRGASGRFGSPGNNQARHHMPHGMSQRTKSLRPCDFSLMIQSFVTSSIEQKMKQPEQANRTTVYSRI